MAKTSAAVKKKPAANDNVREIWVRWWEVFNELLTHALTILFLIGCIGMIDRFTIFMNHGEEKVFFENPSQHVANHRFRKRIIMQSSCWKDGQDRSSQAFDRKEQLAN